MADSEFIEHEAPSEEPTRMPGSIDTRLIFPGVGLIVVGIIGGFGVLMTPFSLKETSVPSMTLDLPNGEKQVLSKVVTSYPPPLILAWFGFYAVANVIIIAGGICTILQRFWPAAFVASLLAMINVPACACVLGVFVGVWALGAITMGEVKAEFR